MDIPFGHLLYTQNEELHKTPVLLCKKFILNTLSYHHIHNKL